MNNRTKTISVTSGKGGVGKTTLVANMAVRMAQTGSKVLILDGDLGLANVDILFGVKTEGHLLEVLNGKKSIRDVLCEIAPGIHLIPGGSGIAEFHKMNNFQRRAMLEAVSTLPHDFDVLLIDTAPGISENVLALNAAVQDIVVVITQDPASLADAYALIKLLHLKHKENRFSIVCNQVRDAQEGLALFARFQEVVTRFLNVGLDYRGSVPLDPVLRKSNQMQRLVLRHEPQSESARAIRDLCPQLTKTGERTAQKAGLQLFWEQVVGVA